MRRGEERGGEEEGEGQRHRQATVMAEFETLGEAEPGHFLHSSHPNVSHYSFVVVISHIDMCETERSSGRRRWRRRERETRLERR